MNAITLVLIAFGLSFIGSLPFGIINMAVAHTALQKGLKAALIVAAGAAFIEFFQVFVALKFTWLFTDGGSMEQYLHAIAMAVFLAAGIYFFFFAKSKAAPPDPGQTSRVHNLFGRGMFVSTLNVMAIPYWVFYGAWLTAEGVLEHDNTSVLLFSSGTVLGTFTLLLCYALLGDRILSKYENVTRWVNRFIGLVLFGLGVYQLVKVVGM